MTARQESDSYHILEALLETLKDVHDYSLDEIVVGTHLMGVKTRQVGLASLLDPCGGHLKDLPDESYWKSFESKRAKEIAFKILEMDTFDAGLGLASITSLYEYSNMEFIKVKAQDIIVEKGKGKEVAVVGHFPFVTRIRENFQKLWVIELDPGEEDIDAEKGFEILPECDVVAITATTIINKTLGALLAACKRDSFKILLGPSTPLTPVLFDFGINMLAGSRVVDEARTFAGIRQGKPFRFLEGIETVCLLRD